MASPDSDANMGYSASVQAGSPPGSAADTKRTIFGRKKKSSLNLGGSSSAGTLTSENNESVESFGSNGSAKKKGVKDIFKRRGREDSLGTEDGQGDGRGKDDEGFENDSDPETTPKLRPQTAGHLNRKPGFFGRRSTSPIDPLEPRNRTSTMPAAYDHGPIAETEVRPSTSGAESRLSSSEPRDRRSTRALDGNGENTGSPQLSVGTSAGRKTSSSFPKVNTSDVSTLEVAPQITATPPTPIENASQFASKNQVVNGSQKRARASSTSKTPSKLSQSMTTPATPPATADGQRAADLDKEGKDGRQGGGFFQSMFSAAQNAATTLTNTIPLNLPNQQQQQERPRTGNTNSDERASTPQPEERVEPGPDNNQPEREPAVKTLGSGELSLAALGISTESESATRNRSSTATSAASEYQQRMTRFNNGSSSDLSQRSVDRTPTMPMSALSPHGGFETAGESPISPDMKPGTPMAEDTLLTATRRGGAGGDVTPDRGSVVGADENEAPDGHRGTGSIRSGQGSDKAQRNRGSSGASAPNGMQLVPRATGFAVATKKRNRDFHNLFKSVPEDDYLIEDYGCALQKEILLQGRFYVSEGHICFYSNILGWVTQLVISFDEVVSVEKKSTALLFPNAIVIQTLHARHTFASFITRDATYDLIIGLWNVGHPGLVQTPGEAHLDGTRDDGNDSGDEEDDEYEDDSDDDLGESFTDAGDGGYDEPGDLGAASKNPSRKGSQLVLGSGGEGKNTDGENADFPGPTTHAPTTCGDEHYDKALCDEVFPVPLGRIYSLIFGTQSYRFVTSLLTDEEKVMDLQIPNEGQWTDQGGKKTRQYTYIRPLNGSIGPKQTKCIITESIDFCELEDHVTVTVSTQTPDVPSGGVFLVKTKYCLTWAEDNSTRLVLNCTVEWSGKSWIKGPIEKGANEGQVAFTKSLITCLKRELAPKKAAVRGAPGKGKGKRKNNGASVAMAPESAAASPTTASGPAETKSWGLFEPLRPVFGPVADILGPIMPANITTILLMLVIIYLLIGRSSTVTDKSLHAPGPAQWEARWRSEEVGLWDWLEDRTGLSDRGLGNSRARSRAFQQTLGAKTAAKGLKDYQIKEAITVMEERLEALKRIVEEKNMPDKDSGSQKKV